MMIYNCAGKILVRQNSTLVDGYAHLNKCVCSSVHSFSAFDQRKADMA